MMKVVRKQLAPAVIALGCVVPVSAQQREVQVTWTPAEPHQGSVIAFRVVPDTAIASGEVIMHGQFAGQGLHFDRLPDGSYFAIGGVPIDARGTESVRISLIRNNRIEHRAVRDVPILQTEYPVDILRVAPEFGRTPDSATAARIARERALETEAAGRAHRTPRLWDGPFQRPRPGRITSGYGRAREFNGTIRSRHMGTDIDGVEGAPVRAANRGVVSLIGDHYYSGNLIFVDHGGGLVTAYRHLSRVEVTVGDTVGQGQLIGRVGSTGRVTGPHLHWTVSYGTITVDGMTLLELKPPFFTEPSVRAVELRQR